MAAQRELFLPPSIPSIISQYVDAVLKELVKSFCYAAKNIPDQSQLLMVLPEKMNAILQGILSITLLLWVAGTLSTAAKTYLLVKICMNGSRSRGVGYRVL